MKKNPKTCQKDITNRPNWQSWRKRRYLIIASVTLVPACWMLAYPLTSNTCSEATDAIIRYLLFLSLRFGWFCYIVFDVIIYDLNLSVWFQNDLRDKIENFSSHPQIISASVCLQNKTRRKKTPFWWLIGNGVFASSHIEGGGVTALLDNLIE